ncbi:site-specific DNA-methyltransferase [Thiolapillus sp.]|uniref:site-specific DNA-methyltransferase n=3 Tax=Thiolapillus sp. TaxID=2017437 RepID=UPI0026003B8B|nr:site-specific DNA-methyltransferase [Thiolapillus sp.]
MHLPLKSSEHLRNYAFVVKDGDKTVRIKLVEADTEKDNVKAESGKERRFVLDADNPLSVENGELHIHFHYKPAGKKKQTALNKEAIETIFQQEGFDDWLALLKTPAPTEKNQDRTLLEKHLNDYTARNTFDYFIHKDLGGFLRRELDFYIKNEVLFLDDIDDASFQVTETHLRKIRVLRSIAHKIIRMLAQLEDFQKKLWLKKKFVVETHYCMTLDRVPEALYGEIVDNTAQHEEWVKLGFTTEDTEITEEYLKENSVLVLDTRFFDAAFKDKLLASIENFDEQCDGLLVHSENFQALNLMQERYREQVKCVYIDPPYNTGGDGFAYKDRYQHSSWLAALTGRAKAAYSLLSTQKGCFFSCIDDGEQDKLRISLDIVFGEDNFVANVIWQKKYAPANDATWLSDDHDFLVLFAKDKLGWSPGRLPRDAKQNKAYSNPDNDPRGRWRADNYKCNKTADERPNLYYPIIHPKTGEEIWPNRNAVWRYTKEQHEKNMAENRVWWGKDGRNKVPAYKRFLSDVGDLVPRTIWKYDEVGHNQDGIRQLRALMPQTGFTSPKPVGLLERVVQVGKGDLVLDYFAGSGTTAHAVINLNREDGGKRKYILVEMGEYFDTVLKPRIQKVVYSRDWKDGKPKPDSDGNLNGISHCFKYLRLESYEDTLNNLILKDRTEQQDDLLKANPALREDYMLGYWLDVETADSPSLLNIKQFEDPFNYRLHIATGSVGATKPTRVDLVETLNYLIGLTVKHIDTVRGFRVVTGTNPKDEFVLVIWRNLKEKDNAALEEFMEKQAYHPRDTEFDHIYVNGDHILEDPHSKVKMIEIEFKRLMFDVRDV